MRMLIVEDQKYPLMALELAVKSLSDKAILKVDELKVVKCYLDAERLFDSKEYDIILLDNRMPMENLGDLEDTDFEKFSQSLKNIGYSLIPRIREKSPHALIIGTSSLSRDELRELPTPDYKMSKMFDDAETDLERILKECGRR